MVSAVEFPKYESYKNSNSDWFDEIPGSWDMKRIKHLVNIRNGLDHKNVVTDEGYPVYGSGGKFAYAKEFLFDGEVILLGRKGTIDKPLHVEGKFWTVDTMFYAVPKSKVNGRFFYYCCTRIPFSFYSTSTALPSMTQADLNNHCFAWPIWEQQALIANFLDKKTTQIDEAIAIKEQQIALLKERKQIIIQKAVTQGLDPNVPLKDSGVDWIGRIPVHWEVKRAKYVFDEIDERSKTGDEELLSVSHMTGVTPRAEKNVSMFMAEDYTGSKLCRESDLVINIMWAWMGALGVAHRIGIVSPSYGVFRQKVENTFNPIYLEYLLKSVNYVDYYNKVSTGLHSSRLRFYGHMLFAMKMGYPGYEEQNEIVAYLCEQTKRIDLAVDSQLAQIQKLIEYKTTLINSAVTGKIKVTAEMAGKQKKALAAEEVA